MQSLGRSPITKQLEPRTAESPAGTSTREWRAGEVLGGRYELRRELGRGPDWLVFEARHLATHRIVTVKLCAPAPQSGRDARPARLLREARAFAAARHSGLVEILDGATGDDGETFIVLEKLDGRTLEGLLAARGRLSPEDAVAVGLQLCESLQALHRAGIVHRDLKPATVLVARDRDGVERLKLFDLGHAKAVGSDLDKLTGIGALIGTPAYMAPEQLLALEVDSRVDLYAVGVTLFECLTSRLPYGGSYPSVLLQVSADDVPVPLVSDHVPELPRELSSVLRRAMARKPDDRFATATDLGRALYAAMPGARSRTFLLGPPPGLPFGPPAPRPQTRELRRFARATFATPVQVSHERGAVDGRSEDISEQGMLVICREPFEPGVLATVRFAPPIEGKVVTCRAHVRWARAARQGEPVGPRALGLEFVDLPETARQTIARYVSLMGSPGGEP